uniref:Uncharacterized protein n=1 Tax=Hyaloperonospora arabidopsidis (strain Emoy2) TaxID=559515 RepID=M4BM74_HYAAE
MRVCMGGDEQREGVARHSGDMMVGRTGIGCILQYFTDMHARWKNFGGLLSSRAKADRT